MSEIPPAVLIVTALIFLGLALWIWRTSQPGPKQLPGRRSMSANPNPASSESGETDALYRNLLDNLTHDISNPLNNILSILENMSKYSSQDEARWRQAQQLIGAEVRRLAKLTEDAKLLMQLQEPDAPITRERVNMKAVAEAVIMTCGETAQGRGVSLSYQGPSHPPWVLGDEAQLKRALFNLVENGIKYARAEAGAVVIGMRTASDKLQVEVSDNGPGIPPDNLEDIWSVAYRVRNARTLKIPGTGFGLAIVKRIVEQQGGEVRVWSQLGEGSTFTFTLPLYLPPTGEETGQKALSDGKS